MNTKRIFHRILIGIDPKGLGRDALHQGLSLARELALPADVVHAVELPPPYWAGIDDQKLMSLHAAALAEAREQVLPVLREACSATGYTDLPAEQLLHVSSGHPAEVLLQTALDKASDLVFIGPHAKRSLFDFGNTARALLSQTAVPIWVQIGEVVPVRRILVPIDFSDHSRRAMEHAQALAQKLGAAVRVLHAHSPTVFSHTPIPDVMAVPTVDLDHERDATRAELESWMTSIEWGGVEAEPFFAEGEVRQILENEADDYDLVVMGTHGRTGLSRFLLGSVAYAALKHATKPILVVPDTERAWLLHKASQEAADSQASGALGMSC